MPTDNLTFISTVENVIEVLVLSSNILLSMRYFTRLKSCYKSEISNLQIIFCLSNLYSIIYTTTRSILLCNEYMSFLTYIPTEILKRTRCFTLMWALCWLTFVSFERFIGTVLVNDKNGKMERTWRVAMLVGCHTMCVCGTIIDKIPDLYPQMTNEILLPVTVVISTLSILGFFLLKRTNIHYYHKKRFAGLSKQFKISRNIRLLVQLEKWFIFVFVDFTITNMVLLTSYIGYSRNVLHKPLFCAYLILLASMFTLISLTALGQDVDHFMKKCVQPHDSNEVTIVNVLNENIYVENTPENNFNALQQIWMETKNKKY